MTNRKRIAGKPSRIVRLTRSASIPKMKAMRLYHAQLKKHNKPGVERLFPNQTIISIGTDNSWFNAQEISREPGWIPVTNANYVWFSGNSSSENAVISTRFSLSQRRTIRSASLSLSIDNYAVVIINGVPLVYDAPQSTPSFFNTGRRFNVGRFLRRGRNDIVIIAFNFGGPRSASNPAGVAARLDIRLSSLL
jgi:hypothetical protein